MGGAKEQWIVKKQKREIAEENHKKLEDKLAQHQKMLEKKIAESKAKIAGWQDMVTKAKQTVSALILENSVEEMKKELEAQQKLNKEKDEHIERLEPQVWELRADSEELTARLNGMSLEEVKR